MLRQTTAHLKKQNWTAIVIDLIVLILGVFIGIEAANWNSERLDRRRSHEVLLDLEQEFTGFDHTATALANFYQNSLKNELVLLASLRAGTIKPEDRGKVRDALAYGLSYGDPPPQSGTYRDLLNSGKLALIGDKRLRIKLIEYDQSIDVVARSDTNIQIGLTAFYPAFTRHMTANAGYKLPTVPEGDFLDAKADFSNVTIDFEGLLADPEFRVAAEQAFLAQQSRLINIRLAQRKIAAIRKLVSEDLRADSQR